MREAEARGLPFLFKLRLTANVKRMIEKLASAREWVNAGQGFEAKESEVRLTGWSRQRRVIVLRRRLKDALGAFAERRWRRAAACVRRDRRSGGSLRILGSGHFAR